MTSTGCLRFAGGYACAWAAFAVGLLAQQPSPTPQQPTFRSGTQLVEVDVRVFDKDGHFVTGLKPEDFIIKEDGAVQPITSATLIGGTTRPNPNPNVEPPNANPNANPNPNPNPNREPSNGTAEPPNPRTPEPSSATWVFIFDTLHLSDAGLHNTRDAVEAFLRDRFHDGDIGGVIVDGKMANNRLTSVRAELVQDVDAVRVPDTTFNYQKTMRREWPPIADEFEAWRIADRNDGEALQQAESRACTMDPDMCRTTSPEGQIRAKAANIMSQARASTGLSLRIVEGLSGGLARMAGPKTVVYISEGFVVQGAEDLVRDATGMANRAGIHFYTIDARGMNKGSASSDIIDQTLAFDAAGAFTGFDMQEDGTNALAVDTGGVPIRNVNNFGRALDEIQADAGTYYVIGYTPSNQNFDGKYRKIDVTVNRSGTKVRARRGYLALEPAKLLKPVAIAPPAGRVAMTSTSIAPEALPEEAAASANPAAGSPTGVVTNSPETAAAEASAIRMRIDNGGLVAALRGSDASATTDPASLGWAAYQKGDVESAEQQLTKAAADPAAHPWVHYVLGLCHLALNEYPAAAAAWEHVRTSVPAFEPVYFNLADAYSLEDDRKTALGVLDAAARRWPKDAEVFNAKGVIQIHARALPDAIDAFERATKLAPKDPVGFLNLASAHHTAALRLHELATNRRAQLEMTQEDRRLMERSNGSGLLNKAYWHRTAAIQAYHRVVALRSDYVDQAKKGLAALQAK